MFGIQDLPLFILSGLLLNITPGADTLFIVTCSVKQGWRAGVVAALGISAGCYVHIVATALGLSALLAASNTAFTLIKLLGAGYLLYLGFGLLRSQANTGQKKKVLPPSTYKKIFAQAFLTDALNPKMALFFLAFVPQFIEANAENKPMAFMLLGLIFNINATLWCLFLAAVTGYFRHKVTSLPGIIWFSRAVGAVFIVLGVKLGLPENGFLL
jgi:threonine/homoserine/homoserine lactone efflux protein